MLDLEKNTRAKKIGREVGAFVGTFVFFSVFYIILIVTGRISEHTSYIWVFLIALVLYLVVRRKNAKH